MFKGLLRRAATRRLTHRQAIALGVGAALLAALLRASLQPVLQDEAEFTPNFLALFAAAYLGGCLSGVVSMLLTGLISFYFFFDPAMTFHRPGHDVLSLFLFWSVGALILASLSALRATFSQLISREDALLAAKEQEQRVAQEMGHRIKNLLIVVQAIVARTLAGAADLTEAGGRIADRLKSLAAAQDLVLSDIGQVGLADLVQRVARSNGD